MEKIETIGLKPIDKIAKKIENVDLNILFLLEVSP